MPIVLTVKTDQNGNWIYDLDKSLTNGKHEAYVAINNDTGRLVEASAPKPFFIQEAKAVSLDEYVGITDASSVPDQTKNFNIFLYFRRVNYNFNYGGNIFNSETKNNERTIKYKYA